MRFLGALALSLSLVSVACVGTQGCGERRAPQQAATPAAPRLDLSKPRLRLVAITDLAGYLRPCGCQSRPLGGIDKAAAELAQLRAAGAPVVFVAAGDLLFGDTPEGAGSASEAQTQETWKAETVAEILHKLGLAAAAPGARDLTYSKETLSKLASAAQLALLPAGPAAGEAPEDAASTILNAGDVKLGVVGVSTFAPPGSVLEPAREAALIKRVQAQVDAVRSQGAQLVVVLASASQRFGRRLAGALRGADFTLLGGNADAIDAPPSAVGSGYLLRARSQGHGLLVVDVFARDLASQAPMADVSTWSRRERDKDLQTRIDELATRIAAWEKAKDVNAADLAEQREKLAALRAQLAAGASTVADRAFDARFVELAPEVKGDTATGARIDAYDARVNEHNKLAFADVLPPKAAPGEVTYVGSERCKSCHSTQFAWWTKHPHGRAYTTLVDVHKEFNLSCVACHVTGYMRPGGSSLVHNAGLVHVGCESCHGAGSKHVANPDDEPALGMTRDVPEDTCKHCHTPEHSDLFDYAKYRAKLIVPGHGLPPTAAAPAAKP